MVCNAGPERGVCEHVPVSLGPATSAGSRARPGKPACESRVLGLGLGQEGSVGAAQDRREGGGILPGPQLQSSPGAAHIFTEAREAGWLELPGRCSLLHTRLFPSGHTSAGSSKLASQT